MFTLRCTQKLLQRMHLKASDLRDAVTPEPTTALGDWYAHLLFIQRQHLVMFVSEHSRLCVLSPAKDIDRLLQRFPQALEQLLRDIGISEEHIVRERTEMSQMCYGLTTGATNGRSVLGNIRDYTNVLESSDVLERSLAEWSLKLSDWRSSPIDNKRSADVTRALLESPQNSGLSFPLVPVTNAASTENLPLYELKIVLDDVRPPIWRRVQVPADIRLDELHLVLQAAMGWTNSHLHAFTFGQQRYTFSYEEGDLEELQMEDETTKILSDLLTEPKETFRYAYDFGDSWEHTVTLEKRLPAAPGAKYPLCVEGKRACPPEDCGGIWGYAELLEVLSDPEHPDYREMRAWAGRKFDPEVFDCAVFSKNFKRLHSYL